MKSKRRPRKSWFAQVDFSNKEVALQDNGLDIKLINRVLDKREGEVFEMALEDKPKLQIYRELKQEIWFKQ